MIGNSDLAMISRQATIDGAEQQERMARTAY
jgi:hypothetical protein